MKRKLAPQILLEIARQSGGSPARLQMPEASASPMLGRPSMAGAGSGSMLASLMRASGKMEDTGPSYGSGEINPATGAPLPPVSGPSRPPVPAAPNKIGSSENETPEQTVIRIAQEEGVDPRIAMSVWKQESGGKADLDIKGPVIPEGKWAGHWGRGPWQIMTFHGDIPDTFEGQTRWAMKHLKERGVEGYYGKGSVPGLPDMPDSKEYAQQVKNRAAGMSIEQAATSQATPQMDTVPVDPASGMPVPQPGGGGDPYMNRRTLLNMISDTAAARGAEGYDAYKPDGMEKFVKSPLFSVLLGNTRVGNHMERQVNQEREQYMRNMVAQSLPAGVAEMWQYDPSLANSLIDRQMQMSGVGRSGAAPKPYSLETVTEGEEEVTYQYNPNTGEMEEVSRGPRWKEDQPAAQNDPAAVKIAKEMREARERAGTPMTEQEYADTIAEVHYRMRPTDYDEERARMTQFGKDFPEDLKNQAMELKGFASTADRSFNAGIILDDIFEVTGASGWDQIFSSIPNTDSRRLRGVVDTLKSNIVLDEMIRLKEASPQGATGFGSMNLQELKTLQESIATLDPNGNEDDLKADLMRIMRLYKRTYESAVEGYRLGREWYNDYNQVPYTPRPLPTKFSPVEERFDPWSDVKKARDAMRPENNLGPNESNW